MLKIIYISCLLLWCLVLLKGFHNKLLRHGVEVESWTVVMFSLLLSPLSVLSGLITYVTTYHRRFSKDEKN